MNKCDKELQKTVQLGSHKISQIQVFYNALYGTLFGLIFFSADKEIARIGYTEPDTATFTITLAKDEIWCCVSKSRDDGYMSHFKFITARLE